MRRLRRILRRPTGPAERIKNPLARIRLEGDLEPRVIDRSADEKMPQDETDRRKRITAARARQLVRITQAERNKNARHQFPIPNIPPGDGKSCAVVGNASSILQQNNGTIIDTHDIIVRINTPKITCAPCQGSRTDYLFVTALSVGRLPRLQCPPYIVFNVSIHHTEEVVNKWSSIIRESLGNDRARPTTGFMAAMYMIEQGYRVSLFGFDWFNTPSIPIHPSVKSDTHWHHHYPVWERQVLIDAITSQGGSIDGEA